MEQPQELRELANWYRGWGDIGTEGDRAWREGFANYLERLAGELESAQMRDEASRQPVESRPHWRH